MSVNPSQHRPRIGKTAMRRLLQRFLKDEAGIVVSAEIVLITTVLVIGAMTGLSALSSAVNSELNS
ncbi:MAG: Flp family type IVb pilin, partial [bacterium]